MTLEEMKHIADGRTRFKRLDELVNSEFIIMCDGNFDDLIEGYELWQRTALQLEKRIEKMGAYIEKQQKVIEPIKFILDHEPEQLKEMNEIKFGNAWSILRRALEELENK